MVAQGTPQGWDPSRVRERLLELDTRRRIYERILDAPGIHLRGLARDLAMPLGTLEHHLHQLERNGLVGSEREGRQRTFFVSDQVDPDDLHVLRFLRQPVPRRILATLLHEPEVQGRALAQGLPHDASTVSYHLRRLVQAGIVDRLSLGRHHYYRATDRARVGRLLADQAAPAGADLGFSQLVERSGRAATATPQGPLTRTKRPSS